VTIVAPAWHKLATEMSPSHLYCIDVRSSVRSIRVIRQPPSTVVSNLPFFASDVTGHVQKYAHD
jgi:hypothetical protein